MIIGASGHGKSVADVALKMNRWEEIVFVDDAKRDHPVMGIEVIGTVADVDSYLHTYDVFVAIGHNAARERIQERLERKGARVPILIHPNAVIGEEVEIKSGTVIMAGAIVNCCVQIGKGCIINTGATVDHDNVIGDYVHLSPGAHTAGSVTIGNGTWLGIGSAVSNNVSIASGCLIGAGGVVVRDLTEAGVYVGVPARRMKDG